MSPTSMIIVQLTDSGTDEQLGKISLPEVPFPGDELLTVYGVLRVVRRCYLVPPEGFAGALVWVRKVPQSDDGVERNTVS